jgi:hypothetical protein
LGLVAVGNDVSKALDRELYERTDIRAGVCKIQILRVVAKPILNNPKVPDNPNHADIEGWPEAKEDQKESSML